MSSIQKSLLKSKLPPFPPPRANKRIALRKKDYTPTEWNKYFDGFKDVKVNNDTFRVYTLGSEGPALVLLHGGGLSALGWSLFAVSISKLIECQVLAIDLRGHGSTKTSDDTDLSSETLAADIGNVLSAIFGDKAPWIVLMGHSMGGAIGVHTAVANHVETLAGLVVIDVVEGTAMDALSSMQSFLRGRPKTFTTLENAIEWCVRSGQVRNIESAKVSMPGQIVNIETGELAVEDIPNYVPVNNQQELSTTDPNQILEEVDPSEGGPNAGAETGTSTFKTPLKEPLKPKYKWRIDLTKTETHWPGWFAGMSKLFLSVNEPKLLILAGIDTLDRELMVGQMQGKFQVQVMPQCGHAVHEDVPDRVAELMASFLVRNRLAEPTAEFQRPFPAC